MRWMVRLFLISALFIPAARAQEGAAPQKPPEAYAPGLGDFMTAYVQPHHIKLYLAGHAKNWALAEYEAGELRETFEDVTSYQGNWHDYPVAKLIKVNIDMPLGEVDQAIREQNAGGFDKAFEKLTFACDACHQAVNHPFLVIKVPTADAYPDQEFTPR